MKATRRYHLTPIRAATRRKPSVGEDVKKLECLGTVGRIIKMVQTVWNTVLRLLKKLKTEKPRHSSPTSNRYLCIHIH